MTLLAAFTRFGVPFLLSDILRTRRTANVQHGDIATHQDVAAVLPPEEGWSIEKPVQKAYAISDTVCVAMGGDYEEGRTAIRQIATAFRGQRPGITEFSHYIQNEIDRGNRGFALIGWIVDQGKPIAFQWTSRYSPINAPEFQTGSEFIGGSGADEYRKRIHSREVVDAGYRVLPINPVESTLEAQCDVLCDVGLITALQLRNGIGLEQLFGGGFQLAYFSGTQFKFIDAYVVAFSQGFITRDLKYEIRVGGPFIAHDWVGDSLVVRRFDLGPGRRTLSKRRQLARIQRETTTRAENVLTESIEEQKVTSALDVAPGMYIFPFVFNWYDGIQTIETAAIPRGRYGPFTLRISRIENDLLLETADNWGRNLAGIAQRVIALRRRRQ